MKNTKLWKDVNKVATNISNKDKLHQFFSKYYGKESGY